jgi:hypothetical protein
MRAFIAGCAFLLLCFTAEMATAQGRKGADSSSISRYPGFDRFLAWATVWGNVKGEGVYTCEEWKRYATGLFNNADRNHDGYVDAQEFETIRQADAMLADSDLAYFDDNRDGRMSRTEFINKPNPFFAHYDRKGTCNVTLDDISDVYAAKEKPSTSHSR